MEQQPIFEIIKTSPKVRNNLIESFQILKRERSGLAGIECQANAQRRLFERFRGLKRKRVQDIESIIENEPN